jgi:hypothetical protein
MRLSVTTSAFTPPGYYTLTVKGEGGGKVDLTTCGLLVRTAESIVLSSLTASSHDGVVKIAWTTCTEIYNAGFNIFRSITENAGIHKINKQLIPCRADAIRGASYTFVDDGIIRGITYYYWLEDVDLYGKSTLHGPISVFTGIDEETSRPTAFTLEQNYPNPFNPITEIRYSIPVDCHVTLEIYNILGRKVVTLVDDFHEAGRKVALWNGRDNKGATVVSGIYFYTIKAGQYAATRKMVLLK